MFLAMCCVLLAYYMINARIENSKPEGYVEMTKVQEVLSRNLETNYPQTPKEVIKYYSEIMKCFYNEKCTEEETYELAVKTLQLYDHELAEINEEDMYLERLKSEIKSFKEKEFKISSYSMSSSTDVYDFKEDGYDFARLYCTYNVRTGTVMQSIEEIYLLRKDLEGHWKIYGWDLAENHPGVKNQ